MTLRRRIGLTVAPLAALLAGVGAAGVGLLDDLGRRSEAILRENYVSLRAMTDLERHLNDAERAARAGDAADFRLAMDAARGQCRVARANVTVSGEREEVEELLARVEEVAARPADFLPALAAARARLAAVRALNEGAMEEADRAARATARRSGRILAGATLAALGLAALAAASLARAVLRPVDDLTRSARAVGDGRFDQIVVAGGPDELGELAGAFNRMTAQLRDLRRTEAARLLRAQQASQAAIDAFPDPVLVLDPGGGVELANPAAARLLGVASGAPWEPPEALRAPLRAALTEQRPALAESFDQAVAYRSGGAERVYLPQVLPVRDPYGGTLGAAVVLSDVTRFRLLDEFKSDLVATASHELKTPLAGLRLAVHLLLEEAVGPLTDQQSELLIDARENTERLVRIVDHLLALARLERGGEPVSPRPEDAGELLRAAAERVGPLLGGRRLDVEVEPGTPPVAADAARLGRALDNLLVNAAAYTPADGRITLSARAAGPGEVELGVADTGVGIPPEHVPHVFDKFFRVPGRSRGQGTGLGLAIVKEVVAAHGGRAACESEPGRGTTFRLTLPATPGPA